jgi:hypothetical protein
MGERNSSINDRWSMSAGETIMSSPVHNPKDLDDALMYAPPWARRTAIAASASVDDVPVESAPTRPSVENGGSPFVGDRAMLALRRRLSLDPEIVPEPPIPVSNGLRVDQIALRLAAVAAVAALVAWVVVALPAKLSDNNVVAAALLPAVTAMPAKPVKLVLIRAELPTLATPVQSTVQSPAVQAAPPILPAALNVGNTARPQESRSPIAEQQSQEPQGEPLAVDKTSPLSPDEIAMLVKRGKDDLMNGDFSSARLLLRRAAEAGSTEAALALGSTFDPLVIARLGAVGVQADPAKARQWYEKAAQLGSNLATAQLAKLAASGR